MAGRKPKPTALKLVQGNPGRRPLNTDEPKPDPKAPPCPEYLGEPAKAAWARVAPELERLGVLTVIDGMALELLVDAYQEWMDAREQVDLYGATYESLTQNGTIIRARPEVAIASDAWRRIRAMLAEFGMTPSSRSRVKGQQEQDEDPFAAFLGGNAKPA